MRFHASQKSRGGTQTEKRRDKDPVDPKYCNMTFEGLVKKIGSMLSQYEAASAEVENLLFSKHSLFLEGFKGLL